jgi:poly-gamma-glutamate synthesis protein (capsule biosynthesis protein)
VLQPFEVVHLADRDGFVAYSMGNFITEMTQPLTQVGLLQELWVRKADGRTTWRPGPHAFTHTDEAGVDLIDDQSAPEVRAALRFYERHLGLQSDDGEPCATSPAAP